MTGTIALVLRLILVAAGGALAGQGLQVELFNPETGVISVHVDDLAKVGGAVFTWALWFFWHRWTKARGGVT